MSRLGRARCGLASTPAVRATVRTRVQYVAPFGADKRFLNTTVPAFLKASGSRRKDASVEGEIYTDVFLTEVLQKCRTIVMVGASPNFRRPSYGFPVLAVFFYIFIKKFTELNGLLLPLARRFPPPPLPQHLTCLRLSAV